MRPKLSRLLATSLAASRPGRLSNRHASYRVRPQGGEWKEDPAWDYELSGDEAADACQRLASFVGLADKLVVITGAGISTSAGIPDYRGKAGSYRVGPQPIAHGASSGKRAGIRIPCEWGT